MCDFGKVIVVIMDELDMYLVKKLKNKGIMKGKIFVLIFSFLLYCGFWGIFVVCFVFLFVDFMMEYLIFLCFVGLVCVVVIIYFLFKIV